MAHRSWRDRADAIAVIVNVRKGVVPAIYVKTYARRNALTPDVLIALGLQHGLVLKDGKLIRGTK